MCGAQRKPQLFSRFEGFCATEIERPPIEPKLPHVAHGVEPRHKPGKVVLNKAVDGVNAKPGLSNPVDALRVGRLRGGYFRKCCLRVSEPGDPFGLACLAAGH